jgi:Ca-activated chloride channel family protein
MRGRFFVAVMAVAGCVAAAQPPTFRADVALVPVFATVTDDDGHPVPDLTKEDFEILDDGKPQPLALFERTTRPLTVVVMLDTSASMTSALDLLKAAAEQFVIRLLPHDRARICVFNDKIQFSGAFTADRDALARSVRDSDYGNSTRLYDGLDASIDALRDVGDRKVILVFTDGEDTSSRTRRRTVTSRARAEDVMVYAIGLRTRHVEDGETVDSTPDPGLRKLAGETGGGYFELTESEDLSSTFTRVGRELHSQYLLAFTPAAHDGRVHSLSVRINRADLSVRTRRSYLAPAE